MNALLLFEENFPQKGIVWPESCSVAEKEQLLPSFRHMVKGGFLTYVNQQNRKLSASSLGAGG